MFCCIVQVSMALALSSPSGYPYDEDEEIAVLESTAAEYRGPSRPRLPEISVISPGLDSQLSITEPVRVNSCVLLLSYSIIFFWTNKGCLNARHSVLKYSKYVHIQQQDICMYIYFETPCSRRKWEFNLWWAVAALMKETQRGWMFFCASVH